LSDVIECRITTADFSYIGQNHCICTENQVAGYTVRRDRFDYKLLQSAAAAGAVIFTEHQVNAINFTGNGVNLTTPQGIFYGRYLAGADGALGLSARVCGESRRRKLITCYEAKVKVEPDVRQRWKSRLSIDAGRTRGYAWVFPKSDHLSVGITCHKSPTGKLKQLFYEYLDSLDLGEYSILKQRGALIPLCGQNSRAVHDRLLLLGDAAGLADPLTGEGLYSAILSAQLAAQTIKKSLDSGTLADYQAVLEKEIIANLKIAARLAGIIYRFPRIALEAFRRQDKVWKAAFRLLKGETDYLIIKESLQELGGLSRVLRI
jgi:flavin-dependent dehydrogenase